MARMNVNLGGLEMATPVATASGTFGYGTEYLGAVDYSKLGAITAKGVRLEPWAGNPMPRHAEVPGGLVNAIGLQGQGVENFLKYSVPWYEKNANVPLIVNIWGGTVEEYAETAARIEAFVADRKREGKTSATGAIEINVSCPNVKSGGHTFGQDPEILHRTVAAVRKETTLPLIVKLAPNVPSIAPFAKAAENAGADALCVANTYPAMVIDIEKRRPALGNKTGGLSGLCIHPASVKLVYDAHKAVDLPILASGGVCSAREAIEFMLAGATAVAVGTAVFSNPDVVAEVCDGISGYCDRHGFAAAADLTGNLEE
ncbi:MAG: dihydroorotate dehydrogenase [Kiritimatiellae bacterium]|nr:dihydroorotate dehydrogenase [Kiritimatiellia bacterium]